jgi:hypothetical protein
VTLSLTAPTSGATVGVRTIKVAGTVAPAHAAVRIAGRRVRVHHGVFTAAIHLRRSMTRIRVTARARGFISASVQTVVHFSARTAQGMLIAERQSTGSGPTVGGDGTGWISLNLPFGSAAGRRHFMANCESGDATATKACTCLYTHFVASGAFSTRAKLSAFYRQTITAVADQNGTEVPYALRSGFVACAPQIFQTAPGSGSPSG